MSWRPQDFDDFEHRIVNLEPNEDFIFRKEEAAKEDKRRNIIDKRRSEEDLIPGKPLDREDLINSDPIVETVKMMRAMGMQASTGNHTIPIAIEKKLPKIMYDRNRPILLGSEFFEFRLIRKKEPQLPK